MITINNRSSWPYSKIVSDFAPRIRLFYSDSVLEYRMTNVEQALTIDLDLVPFCSHCKVHLLRQIHQAIQVGFYHLPEVKSAELFI